MERVPSHALENPGTTSLGRRVTAVLPSRDRSGFRLLSSGDTAYRARLALVDQAEQSLDLQYYVVERDPSTRELFARIRRAAEYGVRVRILLDDLNTVSRDAALARYAAHPNVEIRLFNPFPAARSSLASRFLVAAADLGRLTRRMHNKLFVADNAVAIAGGRNLGAAYFEGTEDVNFADLDVLAAGPVVRDQSRTFDRNWNSDLAYPVDMVVGRPAGLATTPVPSPASATASLPASPGPAGEEPSDALPVGEPLQRLVWAHAHVLADPPTKVASTGASAPGPVFDSVLAMLRRAGQSVAIVSPYVIPSSDLLDALRQLRDRGVAVQVLTNSLATTDMPVAHAAYARHRVELLTLGVQLHELRATPGRRGGLLGASSRSSRASLHAKGILVDGRWLVVGSMNLDPRSALENTEVGIVIDSAELGAQMARLIGQGIQPEASYALRLEPDGRTIQWTTRESGAEHTYVHDPEAGFWRSLANVLLRVTVPEAPL